MNSWKIRKITGTCKRNTTMFITNGWEEPVVISVVVVRVLYHVVLAVSVVAVVPAVPVVQ